MKIVTTLTREPGDKTIAFSELKRLEFANSRKLPKRIIINGELKMWVGIGWIGLDNCRATGNEPFVVEDAEPTPKKRPKKTAKTAKRPCSRS